MTTLAQSLTTLPFEEKLQLVWDLCDSIDMEKSKIHASEADRREVQRRLDQYLLDGNDGEPWEVVRKSISKKNLWSK